MKAITLWNPWASWVALGWKTIETRTHSRFRNLVGQRIAIHAGKKLDPEWLTKADRYMTVERIGKTANVVSVKGAVLCTADVIWHRQLGISDSPAALCNCTGGELFGLGLDNIIALPEPVPATGRQGIWEWTPTEDAI